MMKKNYLLSVFGVLVLSTGLIAQVDPVTSQELKNLYGNLKEVAWDTQDIMFGQEFFNSYSWSGGNHEDENFSDFKAVTGQHPAVLGQDFHYYIYKSATERRKHKEAALKAYQMGCVVTFDFHMYDRGNTSTLYNANTNKYLMYNIGEGIDTYGDVTWFNNELDKIIAVINELKIPIVLRLFHEMNGHWFWWGNQAYGGANSYRKMYQKAVKRIRYRTNYALYAWSPNYSFDTSYYPGDSYVDVVGLDMYDLSTPGGQSFSVMTDQLQQVSDFAYNHDKVPVFAETGNRVNSPSDWPYWWYNMNENIQNSNRAYKVAWMLTWINTDWGNVPYVAHSGSSEQARTALTAFKNMSTVLTQSNVQSRNMYDWSYRNSSSKSSTLKAEVSVISLNEVSIYPNPTSIGYFNVDLSKFSDTVVNIIVTDIQGRQVINRTNVRDTPLLSISVSDLIGGMYVVNIRGVNISETYKVIVQ